MRLLGRFRKTRDIEENDGVPVAGAPSVRPPTISEMVQSMIRREMSKQAVDEGFESFEDADDFEEEDPELMPLTHHQVEAMDRHELQEEANGYGLTLVDQMPDKAPKDEESGKTEKGSAPAQSPSSDKMSVKENP